MADALDGEGEEGEASIDEADDGFEAGDEGGEGRLFGVVVQGVELGGDEAGEGDDADTGDWRSVSHGFRGGLSRWGGHGEGRSHCAHSEDDADADFVSFCHLQSPEHWHWQYDDDEVVDQIDCCGVVLEGGSVPTVAVGDQFVKGVADGSTDEAGAEHDGDERRDVEGHDGPTDVAETGDGEDAEVEEEHGDADADGGSVPNNLEGDELLCSSSAVVEVLIGFGLSPIGQIIYPAR